MKKSERLFEIALRQWEVQLPEVGERRAREIEEMYLEAAARAELDELGVTKSTPND